MFSTIQGPRAVLGGARLWQARPLFVGKVGRRAAVNRRTVQVYAEGFLEDGKKIAGVLKSANSMFKDFDVNNDGELSLEETLGLLNSAEYKEAFESAAGIPIPERSQDDVEQLFKELDADKSGALNRVEFLVLWMTLVKQRCQTDPKSVALALFSFLDSDGDGKLQGREIKRFMPLLGPPGIMMATIPDWAEVNYRKVLGAEEE
ncbi:hypothetical protein CYMTET_10936 [Cymbomonas tetramitiformis]|uniref:EF-hand domain-containing protein n=1 Tax=Cymbomonas tetramitiformis TaxID=36881 RepID=A0AAE0LDN6_9CHLO|nr:hypothetical protein CYMTET_10936 [Cymbomonas tetramitiformis]